MAITASRLEIKPYLFSAHLDMTDIIVLCSDGLWGVVPDSLIWAAASELVPQEAAEKLVDLANRSNSSDNISVIVARRIEAGRKLGSVNLEDTHT
jgi:protein phosphatase